MTLHHTGMACGWLEKLVSGRLPSGRLVSMATVQTVHT